MFTKNGLYFVPVGGTKITDVETGTPFLYKEHVCLPHCAYRYSQCSDYFTGERVDIDDIRVYVTTLKVVDDPTPEPTEEPTPDTERLAALEERVSELEALVKLLIKNS